LFRKVRSLKLLHVAHAFYLDKENIRKLGCCITRNECSQLCMARGTLGRNLILCHSSFKCSDHSVLVSHLMQQASGKKFQEVLEEAIIRPLDINGELYIGIPPGIERKRSICA
jgi:hypothetical protein